MNEKDSERKEWPPSPTCPAPRAAGRAASPYVGVISLLLALLGFTVGVLSLMGHVGGSASFLFAFVLELVSLVVGCVSRHSWPGKAGVGVSLIVLAFVVWEVTEVLVAAGYDRK